MTDSKAIKEYCSIKAYFEIVKNLGPVKVPTHAEPTREERAIIDTMREKWEYELAKLRALMAKAERAIDRLPEDLQDVMRCRYILGLDNWRTAENLFLSESTVRRYVQKAFAYLEAEENAKRAGRPPDGPESPFKRIDGKLSVGTS